MVALMSPPFPPRPTPLVRIHRKDHMLSTMYTGRRLLCAFIQGPDHPTFPGARAGATKMPLWAGLSGTPEVPGRTCVISLGHALPSLLFQ